MKSLHLRLATGLLGLGISTAALAAPLGSLGSSGPALDSQASIVLVRDGDEEAGMNRDRFSSNEGWRYNDYYPRYRGDRFYGYSYGPSVQFGLGYAEPYPYRYYNYPYRYRHYGYPYRYRSGPSFGLFINP